MGAAYRGDASRPFNPLRLFIDKMNYAEIEDLIITLNIDDICSDSMS